MNKAVVAVIMAGGLGKRMNSNLPKVLHKISGIPMICHLLLKLKVLSNIVNLKNVLIVVGKYKDLIKEELDKYDELVNYEFVIQEEPLGTGHAVKCCIDKLSDYDNTDVLILSGDVPLLILRLLQPFYQIQLVMEELLEIIMYLKKSLSKKIVINKN